MASYSYQESRQEVCFSSFLCFTSTSYPLDLSYTAPPSAGLKNYKASWTPPNKHLKENPLLVKMGQYSMGSFVCKCGKIHDRYLSGIAKYNLGLGQKMEERFNMLWISQYANGFWGDQSCNQMKWFWPKRQMEGGEKKKSISASTLLKASASSLEGCHCCPSKDAGIVSNQKRGFCINESNCN